MWKLCSHDFIIITIFFYFLSLMLGQHYIFCVYIHVHERHALLHHKYWKCPEFIYIDGVATCFSTILLPTRFLVTSVFETSIWLFHLSSYAQLIWYVEDQQIVLKGSGGKMAPVTVISLYCSLQFILLILMCKQCCEKVKVKKYYLPPTQIALE